MKRQFYNRKKAKQLISFEKMERGQCSWTDGDGMCEIDNKYFFIVESKTVGTDCPIGQRLLMERLCDKNWDYSAAFIVEHDVKPPEDVKLIDCFVREFRNRNGKWVKVIQPKRRPFGEYLVAIERKYNTKKLVEKYE